MPRLVLVVAAVGVLAGCSAGMDTHKRQSSSTPLPVADAPLGIFVPAIPADISIRRHLNASISRDAALKTCEISFIVTNGDVNVTGTVRTEAERRKMNDLAMSIDGVKSVANALRIVE